LPLVKTSMLRLVAMPVLGVVLLAACASSEGSKAAATVGAEEIPDSELVTEANLFRFLSAINQQPCGQAVEGESPESACNRFALSQLILNEIVTDAAADLEIEVTEEQIDEIIADLDGSLGAEAVETALTEQELTREDLRVLAEQVLLFQEAQTAVAEREVGEEALKALYEERVLDLTTVEVDHILVDSEAEADDVYTQVTAAGSTREDFKALASEVSTDPAVAENGGTYAAAPASGYVPEFANAAVGLEPGEISKPVKTEFGWHVIRLETKQVTPFEEARASLLQDGAGAVFNEWIRSAAADLGVDVNPRYGRWDEETLTVLVVRSTDPSAEPTEVEPSVTGAPTTP
jgi:foldase protein PrsA